MDFNTYVRKPFRVQAVQVTEDNIQELAKFCSGKYCTEDGHPYILVDKKSIPNVLRIEVGFFVTKMGKNIRAFSEKVFNEQFTSTTPEVEEWMRYLNGTGKVDASE